MASLILGSIGTAIGGPIGGFIGSAIGSLIDSFLFTPAPPDVTGPRIEDTSTARADPGEPIPLVFGADRMPVIIIGTTELLEKRHDEKVKSGKKSFTSTTFSYSQTVDLMLCEGPILGIGRIWADGKPMRGVRDDLIIDTQANRFNVGGFPYPSWYREAIRMYDPALCPWSLDPVLHANPSATRWVLNASGDLIVADATLQAATVDNGNLVYWQDLDTLYFHPLASLVAYDPSGSAIDQFGSVQAGTLPVSVVEPLQTSFVGTLSALADVPTWDSNVKAAMMISNGAVPFLEDEILQVAIGAETLLPENQITEKGTVFYTSLIDPATHPVNGVPDQLGGGQDFIEIGYTKDFLIVQDDANKALHQSHIEAGNGVWAGNLGMSLSGLVGHNQTADWRVTARLSDGTHTELYTTSQFLIQNNLFVPVAIDEHVTFGIPRDATHIRVTAKYWPVSSSPFGSMNLVMNFESSPSNMFSSNMAMFRTGNTPEPSRPYRTWTDYYNLHAALNDFSPLAVLAFQNPDSLTFYRGTDDQISDPVFNAIRGRTVPGYINKAHLVLEKLQLEDYGNRLPSITVETVRFEDERVAGVVESLMERAGVLPALYDTTALPTIGLDSFIPGYSVARRTTIRKAIEGMLEPFWLDAAEIGTKIEFRQRRRVADHIIPFGDLAAHKASDESTEESITISTRDGLDMPRVIEASYKDLEREYQTNTTREQRNQTINDHQASTELSMVLYPYFVKAWTRGKLQDLWLRKSVEFTLPPRYIYVSPSDIVTIITDIVIGTEIISMVTVDVFATVNVNIKQVRRGVDGMLSMSGVLSNGARFPQDDYDDIVNENGYTGFTNWKVLGFSEFRFLDLPPLSESDIIFGWYFAVSDINNTEWIGTDLLRSADVGTSYVNIGTSAAASAIGNVTTGILSNVTSNVLETTSDIVVTLVTAQTTLTSVTIDQMLNGRANMALIGTEIVCFTDVTYLGNKEYRLSGAWSRGLRGTENVMADHFVGEQFVLLDTAVLETYEANISDRNKEFDYKPVTINVTEALTPSEQYTNTGRRSLPFSPVQLTATRDGSNNMTITWVRRDKLFYSWVDNVDLVMSETDLAYEVDILDGSGVVLRTIEVTAETASYLATEQTTDGLTPGDNVNIRVYQISSTVGRGVPAIEVV